MACFLTGEEATFPLMVVEVSRERGALFGGLWARLGRCVPRNQGFGVFGPRLVRARSLRVGRTRQVSGTDGFRNHADLAGDLLQSLDSKSLVPQGVHPGQGGLVADR